MSESTKPGTDPKRAEPGCVPDWKHHGVRVVHGNELDSNVPQTQGMSRAAAPRKSGPAR
jgi:hypothetical protein